MEKGLLVADLETLHSHQPEPSRAVTFHAQPKKFEDTHAHPFC